MDVLDSGGGGAFTLIRVNFIGGLATCTVRFADGETQNIWQMANVTSNKKKTKHNQRKKLQKNWVDYDDTLKYQHNSHIQIELAWNTTIEVSKSLLD